MAQQGWNPISINFAGSNASMRNAAQNLSNVTSIAQYMQNKADTENKDKLLLARQEQDRQDTLLQRGVENTRAAAGLLLQQKAEQRAIDSIDKNNREDKALLQYTNHLGVGAQDVVVDADAQKMLQAYNASPAGKAAEAVYEAIPYEKNATEESIAAKELSLKEAVKGLNDTDNQKQTLESMYDKSIASYNNSPEKQIGFLQSMALPGGEFDLSTGKIVPGSDIYDSSKLLAQKEKALKRPQDTLDAITAAKVKEADRAQNLKDQFSLADYKQTLKGSGEGTGTGSKIFYDVKTGNAVRIGANEVIPPGHVEASVYNDRNNGTKGKGGTGSIYDSKGQVDQSKTVMGDIKTRDAIKDKVATFLKVGSIDQEHLDSTMKKLYKMQLLSGKSNDQMIIDFDSLSDKGFLGVGTEAISNDKIDRVYKDEQINIINPGTGVAELIPMSKAVRLTDTYDSKGEPAYNITTDNGKVSLTINPSYVDESNQEGKLLTGTDVNSTGTVQQPVASQNTDVNGTGPILSTTKKPTLKEQMLEYANSIGVPGEAQDKEILNAIDMVSGGNATKMATPLLKEAGIAVNKVTDKLLNRVTIPGQGIMKPGSNISKSSTEMKQEFLQKVSDEVATILSKPEISPAEMLRLQEISAKFPSFRESIQQYMK